MISLPPLGDEPALRRALSSYPDVVASQSVTRLIELDRWYREALPGILAARSDRHVTLEELVQIVEWKMKRGEWRERNLGLVRSNSDELVRQTSRAAFLLVPEPRKPVNKLVELSGVGPATASAVLAAAHPETYPFFDEIVAAQIPDLGPVAFTAPYYIKYAARLREYANALGGDWTPHAVAQALWAVAGGKAGSAH